MKHQDALKNWSAIKCDWTEEGREVPAFCWAKEFVLPLPPNRVYFAHEKNIVGRSGHDGLASRQVTGEDKLKGRNYSGTRRGASTQQLRGGKGKARRNWEDNIWWDLMGHGDEQGAGMTGVQKTQECALLKKKKKSTGKIIKKTSLCAPIPTRVNDEVLLWWFL